jgi:type 1 glutamine amidotransferase
LTGWRADELVPISGGRNSSGRRLGWHLGLDDRSRKEIAGVAEVLIISGAGDYSDPWHRFDETSLRLAEISAGLGHQVTVSDAVEEALAEPGEPDLIVVNIGNPREARPQSRIDAAERGLDRHLQQGGALLGVHVSATSMTTMSTWSTMLGGHWVRNRTMHPKQDLFTVVVHSDAHPIVSGLTDFTVFDERYSYLHTNPDITVMCEQFTDGRLHPIVWARESGPARVVYDGLGHDTRSYESEGHVRLLRRTIGWLLRDGGVTPSTLELELSSSDKSEE